MLPTSDPGGERDTTTRISCAHPAHRCLISDVTVDSISSALTGRECNGLADQHRSGRSYFPRGKLASRPGEAVKPVTPLPRFLRCYDNLQALTRLILSSPHRRDVVRITAAGSRLAGHQSGKGKAKTPTAPALRIFRVRTRASRGMPAKATAAR